MGLLYIKCPRNDIASCIFQISVYFILLRSPQTRGKAWWREQNEDRFGYMNGNTYICIKMYKNMKWLFKTIVDGVVNTCYEFSSKEKAEKYQDDFIKDMKKIGCYPLSGLKIKVEQA